jgi:hypothetical protein
MRESILFAILFGILIFGVAIIKVYISPYEVPDIPVEDCAKYLGNTFCEVLYG